MTEIINKLNMPEIIDKRYEIIEPLGKGAFGKTYIAKDLGLPIPPIVVVKKIIIENESELEILQMKNDFDREGTLLQKVGGQDGIPTLHAFSSKNKDFYLVQQYIEGSDLSTRLISGESLNEMETIEILQGILTPLKIVHDNDIIHRDLKPANIRVRESDGKIFLIDFGIAMQIQANINPLTRKSGTPGYMPENDAKPTYSTDIYAVGIIGIQALTGLSAEESGKISPNSLKDSSQLINWLKKAISTNHEDRFLDASTALEALNNLETLETPEPTVIDPVKSTSNGYMPIVWILAVCSFMAIAVAIFIKKPDIYEEKWQTYQNAGIQFD
jgi:eukaryotic-like serine/threonine-protein kinase